LIWGGREVVMEGVELFGRQAILISRKVAR
jgi:hypothetical protein